jgi:phosphoglycolate phosphatase
MSSRTAPAAVFLDLDGCLVDSTAAITTCLNHALTEVGLAPRAVEDLVRFIGPPLPEGIGTLLAEADADAGLVPTCVDAYRARYPVVSLEQTVVIPGIPAALERLGSAAPLAVVTSKPGPFARPILEGLGLIDRFVALHAPEVDLTAEPKAVTLRRALDDVADGQDPAATVMVGDRSHDMAAGRACGTATVGVTWGAGDRQELVGAGADRVVDAPQDLPGAVYDPRSGPLAR